MAAAADVLFALGAGQPGGAPPRTVARQLAAEKTSLGTLVDELRRDLFARYLDDGARTLTKVSALLGPSAPSAFSRWHRQHSGKAVWQLRSERPAMAHGKGTGG